MSLHGEEDGEVGVGFWPGDNILGAESCGISPSLPCLVGMLGVRDMLSVVAGAVLRDGGVICNAGVRVCDMEWALAPCLDREFEGTIESCERGRDI